MSLVHHPEIVITLAGHEHVIKPQVEYYYYPAARGAVERGTGIPMEPDEPATVEIVGVTLNGLRLDRCNLISNRQLDELASEILASHE